MFLAGPRCNAIDEKKLRPAAPHLLISLIAPVHRFKARLAETRDEAWRENGRPRSDPLTISYSAHYTLHSETKVYMLDYEVLAVATRTCGLLGKREGRKASKPAHWALICLSYLQPLALLSTPLRGVTYDLSSTFSTYASKNDVLP